MSLLTQYMTMKTAMATVLAAMITVTSAIADEQADYIKQIRDGGPTADFSETQNEKEVTGLLQDVAFHNRLSSLAEADAMVYTQDNKDATIMNFMNAGLAHAYKHHLLGADASWYENHFAVACSALKTKN